MKIAYAERLILQTNELFCILSADFKDHCVERVAAKLYHHSLSADSLGIIIWTL